MDPRTCTGFGESETDKRFKDAGKRIRSSPVVLVQSEVGRGQDLIEHPATRRWGACPFHCPFLVARKIQQAPRGGL